MKTQSLFLSLSLAALASGCSTPGRILSDAGASAGGAALAHNLSHGDLGLTTVGAAGGLLFSEGLQLYNSKTQAKAYSRGYVQGRSDAVKNQYWMQQHQQKAAEDVTRSTLYPIPIPAQEIDGVHYQPATRVLTIHQ